MQLIHQLVYQLKVAIWPSRIILNNNGCFAKRIQQRHKTFWNSADSYLFKTIDLCADSSLAHWKEGMHWQRKLSKKNNSKEFARLHGCRVAHLYQKIKCADSIDFDSLPSHYVIRPTMGNSCNLVFLMANSVNLMDKKAYTIPELKAILANALNKNPHLEFLFEEFVRTESGEYIIP